jgi:hypothetical protein
MVDLPGAIPTGPQGLRGVRAPVRILAAMAVLAFAGTFLAAQIDFVRRNTMGIPPLDVRKYYLPQLTHIWAPGLGGTLALIALALLAHKLGRA